MSLDELNDKESGELIRSRDWNALVDAVRGIRDDLSRRVDELERETEESLGRLEDRLTRLSGRTAKLESQLRPLRRVELETSKVRYALGEVAEITAEVRALDGSPLDLSDPESRPWVDFVTVWGKLRPSRKTPSRSGAADRTVSVRVDEEGRAAVTLRAEHAGDVPEETEQEIHGLLRTELPDQAVMADVLLEANTPQDEPVTTAFQTLTAQYETGEAFERPSAARLRNFVDTQFIANVPRLSGPPVMRIPDVVGRRWRDHRTTVMAMVKPDADPTTPHRSVGSSALQITYRDWVLPWISEHYLPALEDQVPAIRDRLAPLFRDPEANRERLRNVMRDELSARGAVGRLRRSEVMRRALDDIRAEADDDGEGAAAAGAYRQAIDVQEGMMVAAGAGGTAEEDEAATRTFQAVAEALQVETAVGKVRAQGRQVERAREEVVKEMRTLNDQVQVLDTVNLQGLQTKLARLETNLGGGDGDG